MASRKKQSPRSRPLRRMVHLRRTGLGIRLGVGVTSNVVRTHRQNRPLQPRRRSQRNKPFGIPASLGVARHYAHHPGCHTCISCICCTTSFTTRWESDTDTQSHYTPIAANHFRGPSELPPRPNARPPEDELARAEGMSGLADAADAFRLRFDACTTRVRTQTSIPYPKFQMKGHTTCCDLVTVGF